MDQMQLRRMEVADRWEVAELICISTNTWYQMRGRPALFPSPRKAEVFFDVYEALDPGCGIVAVNERTGRLAGSCFVHPRPTHVSLGIMNVHPNYFGHGVARMLLKWITDLADDQKKPLHLVSSALNLDSFSLYTRAGFVPQTAYQDMYLTVPEDGLKLQAEGSQRVRPATAADIPAMVRLEMEVAGLDRTQDFRFFLDNREGHWHVSVYPGEQGELAGFMVSSGHPGLTMVGPGAARTPEQAAALLLAELNHLKGRTPVFLVPVACAPLVRQMYQWGAKNCELHFSQVRGPCQPLAGLHFPTFLPESS